MRLKILHVSSGNLYGGVETLLTALARERACRPEMEPHFALCFEGRLAAELRAANVPITILGAIKTRFPWTLWRARRLLAGLIARERFDAVVCHMPWSLAIFGPVARRAGVPLIFWMHDAAQGRHWIERWAGRTKPDLVLCNSRFTAGTLPRLFPRGLPRHEVIYYPVSNLAVTLSAQERAGLRGELDTPSDACVILQVGRMEPYKGHTLHLDALARLAALPGWVCWIVGGAQRPHEAAYLAELKARGADSGIADRIRFLGERRDVPRLLACADIFCQPNLRGEPFGIVFIEALQAGLPVVTTALGGALEIVDEDCGRRVAPNDPAALADALHELIASPGLRAQLGGRGPARAELLSHPAAALAKMEMLIGGAVS